MIIRTGLPPEVSYQQVMEVGKRYAGSGDRNLNAMYL
jgi:hypothetical protein